MNYESAVAQAPPGWRHYRLDDVDHLPRAVRAHVMSAVPAGERALLEIQDPGAIERLLRALFWTLVYHLAPERWDTLAQVEPIHPAVLAALPLAAGHAIDVGAGSGRLTHHLVQRCDQVVAVEPALSLGTLIARRAPGALTVAGWAEALPVVDGWSDLTTACRALGPEPEILAELRRVTAPGGLIALINPECPEWFEAHGWQRFTADPLPGVAHDAWIDSFFGPPDPPRELLTMRLT